MSVTYAPISAALSQIREGVREIEDFPREGIFTQDVMPVLQDARLFPTLIEELASLVRDVPCDVVAGIYSRGYMVGAPLSLRLGVPFVPIPKSMDASPSAARESYSYEYSSDTLALEQGAIQKGMRVLLIDDQIVTGGTALAAASLVERLGGVVSGFVFILVQSHYGGLDRIREYPVFALFEKDPSSPRARKGSGQKGEGIRAQEKKGDSP